MASSAKTICRDDYESHSNRIVGIWDFRKFINIHIIELWVHAYNGIILLAHIMISCRQHIDYMITSNVIDNIEEVYLHVTNISHHELSQILCKLHNIAFMNWHIHKDIVDPPYSPCVKHKIFSLLCFWILWINSYLLFHWILSSSLGLYRWQKRNHTVTPVLV